MKSRYASTKYPAICLALLLSLMLTGCASLETESFYHQAHRGIYAFSDQDLQRMQFYISREVLAHLLTADGMTSAEDVILLPPDTLGKVLEVGPNWLRVSFQEGGAGAVFLASGRGEDLLYKLATKVEGRSGFHRLEDGTSRVLLNQGMSYKIIHGANAFLLIDQVDLEEMIAERTHLEGVEK